MNITKFLRTSFFKIIWEQLHLNSFLSSWKPTNIEIRLSNVEVSPKYRIYSSAIKLKLYSFWYWYRFLDNMLALPVKAIFCQVSVTSWQRVTLAFSLISKFLQVCSGLPLGFQGLLKNVSRLNFANFPQFLKLTLPSMFFFKSFSNRGLCSYINLQNDVNF